MPRKELRPRSFIIHRFIAVPWVFFFFLETTLSMADLTVHSIFGDHMVLQRNQPILVWGTGDPAGQVEVALDTERATVSVDKDGRWHAVLNAMHAGGPVELEVSSAGKSIHFTDVLIGDVWLCSGQSNMQLPTREVVHADEEIARADAFPLVRLCQVPKTGAAAPVDHMDAPWKVCSSASVADFSAIAYFFARDLRDSDALEKIPIGLIDCSYGGTVVEAWMSSPTLRAEFAGQQLHDSLFGWKPASMYNGMIEPLIPFPLTGVLWYQGESNTPWPDQYENLFAGLIREWRRDWNRPELPFLFVQLPNYTEKFGGAHFTWLRNAQARVAAEVPHTGMAVTIDTSDGFDLHPKHKREVARRLALLARKLVYGEDIVASGPVPQSARIEGRRIRVLFTSVGSGLVAICTGQTRGFPANDNEVQGFTVAGKDGLFRTATARIEGMSVVVEQKDVRRPWYVRYAWSGNPRANLYNAQGLPAAPFRTDALPRQDLEVERCPVPYAVNMPMYAIDIAGDGCVDHLRILGNEFLDTESELLRGAAFYTFWGPARMFHVQEEGPTLLSAENETAAVEYRFHPEFMEWVLRNKTTEPLPFRIRLASDVEIRSSPADAGAKTSSDGACTSATLRLGNAILDLRGIDRISRPSPGEPFVVEVSLHPKEERTLHLTPQKATSTKTAPPADKPRASMKTTEPERADGEPVSGGKEPQSR